MTALTPMPTIVSCAGREKRIDDAELAVAAFLARYLGRTLDAYRYHQRAFFQWAADEGLVILSATRPQIELYVRAMEGGGLAATWRVDDLPASLSRRHRPVRRWQRAIRHHCGGPQFERTGVLWGGQGAARYRSGQRASVDA